MILLKIGNIKSSCFFAVTMNFSVQCMAFLELVVRQY